MYPNRRFVIFDVSELNKINFDEVLETSADTVRKSLDETKTFVKFDIFKGTWLYPSQQSYFKYKFGARFKHNYRSLQTKILIKIHPILRLLNEY